MVKMLDSIITKAMVLIIGGSALLGLQHGLEAEMSKVGEAFNQAGISDTYDYSTYSEQDALSFFEKIKYGSDDNGDNSDYMDLIFGDLAKLI